MRNKPNYYTAIVLLLLALVGIAEPSTGKAASRHTLWKVQGPRCTVYLLGSIHVLKESDYPLPASIESAFSNASVVAFETDIGALEQPAVALKLMSRGALPPDESLSKQLSAPVYLLWSNHVRQSGMPAALFERLTPAMAGVTLTMLEMQKLGLDPQQGVDKHFFALARTAGKEIVPLETVDFQINLLTDFTREEGELLLSTTLKEMDSLKKEVGDLIKAWKSGDAEALDKLLTDAMKEAPAIYKRMLTDRNQNWAPKIEALARGKKNAVVIVGAAHLVGKDGVVELLKKKGLLVQQE